MQYQLLGVSSGFSAHMLSTLLVSWRRMVRAAAIAGALGVIAVEAVASAIVHQFPPTLPTNAVAVALGIAAAYSAAASIFARELLRGALRALTLLQDGAGALMGATAVATRPTDPHTASATPVPLTAMRRSAADTRVERISVDAQPQSDASSAGAERLPAMRGLPSLPAPLRHSLSPLARAQMPVGSRRSPGMTKPEVDPQPHQFIEDEPTRPVTIGEGNGMTVTVAPDAAARAPQAMQAMQSPRVTPFTPPESQFPESQFEAAHPLPAGVSVPLPPLVQASPPPGLYAPWSEVQPIADPAARTEMGTIAAQDSALNGKDVQAAIARGRWPRRVFRPVGSGNRHGWWSRGRGRAARVAG